MKCELRANGSNIKMKVEKSKKKQIIPVKENKQKKQILEAGNELDMNQNGRVLLNYERQAQTLNTLEVDQMEEVSALR